MFFPHSFPTSFLGHGRRFRTLSDEARGLLLAMMADDPADRPSAAAVLRHPFTTERTAQRCVALDQAVRHKILELAATR